MVVGRVLAVVTSVIILVIDTTWSTDHMFSFDRTIRAVGGAAEGDDDPVDSDDCPARPDNFKKLFGESRCKKSCLSHSQCRRRNKRCLCDGECGMSCVNPKSRCHALVDVPNGFVRSPSDFVFNSKAEYSCDEGYTLHGPTQRRCQGNREWSGKQPTCRLKAKCGAPPVVPYAEHSDGAERSEYAPDEMLHYNCVPGYYRYNSNELRHAKCLIYKGVAQWFGPDLTCSARYCGNPGELTNGVKEGEIYEYPHMVKYRCVGGFELVGAAVRKCQADGEWSGDKPVCRPKACPKPPNPMNGRVLGSSLAFQSRVTYSCHDGYRIVGQVQRVCQADGTWSGLEPTCEEIRCPTRDSISNGYIEGKNTRHDAMIIYRCFEGNTMIGPSFARCQKDATWSAEPPSCMAQCQIPAIEYGHIIGFNESKKVLHGERIQVDCNQHHELQYPEMPLCNNGSWSNIPRCVPFRCKSWPATVQNARVIFVKSHHNSVARYECNPGFRLKGNPRIRCLYGEWKNTPPTCERITCLHPSQVMGPIPNGKVMLRGDSHTYEYAEYIHSVIHGRTITFQCNKGFTVAGPPRATCIDGDWRPNVGPTCRRQTHPSLEGRIVWDRVQQMSVDDDDDDDEQKGGRRRHKRMSSSVYHTCPPLYANRRQKFAVIRLNKLADDSVPNGTQLMALCRPGFQLPDDSDGTIRCSNGTYLPAVPSCQPKSCKLGARAHAFYLHKAEILQSGKSIPHTNGARLVCLRGYELRGNDELECQQGKFLRPAGECVPKRCPLGLLRYGYYELSPLGESVSHGTVVKFSCSGGSFPRPLTGLVTCAFGDLRPHAPECNSKRYESSSEPHLELGCPRPLEIEKAWVYRQQQLRNTIQALLIDPYQDVYPNDTVVHYKCRRMGRKIRLLADEASAVRCIDGEWVAQLMPCASPDTPPELLDNATQAQWRNYGRNQQQRGGQTKRRCTQPQFHTDGVDVVDQHSGVLDAYDRDGYPHGTTLKVQCAGRNNNDTANAAARQWTIKCKRGVWRKINHVLCDANQNRLKPHPRGSSAIDTRTACHFSPLLFTNVIAFSFERGEPLRFEELVRDGDRLWLRCINPGLYKFRGSRELACSKTRWLGRTPSCILLDDSETAGRNKRSPPAIRYRVADGDASITPKGVVVVKKSSNVYLDCIYNRKYGQPKWETTSTYRTYPTEWTNGSFLLPSTIAASSSSNGANQTQTYRLTVAMAQKEDSGVYYCITPKRYRHSIRLKVDDIHCAPIILANETTVIMSNYAGTDWQVGSTVDFSCENGFVLKGSRRITCLDSGSWSNDIPHCSPMSCPSFTLTHPALSADVSSRAFRGTARFRCTRGYTLLGPSVVHCLSTGKWSDFPPTCKVITCSPPDLPLGASIIHPKLTYTYGDVAMIRCATGFMMTGRDFAVCGEIGKWSGSMPECLPYCRFPGTPVGGDLTSTAKDYYLIGERLVFYCRSGMKLVGYNALQCASKGEWSHPLPTCEP